jgi:hypothetical protein
VKPPGNIPWEESAVLIGTERHATFVVKSTDGVLARKFVRDYWSWAYGERSALFICYPPKILGEPVGLTPDGRPTYRPISPPAEVWFLPNVLFGEVWAFARVKGFANSTVPANIVETCDAFLTELATRHPIGVEAVGEGWASFRRHADGGALELPDMRRAWELNLAILGGRHDTLRMDPKMPLHFVRDGVFHFGL